MTDKEFCRVILLASLFCGLIVWLTGESFRGALIATGIALIVLSVAARLVIESAIIVKMGHYGVVLRFGQRRTGRIILDTDKSFLGVNGWVIPLIDKVVFFSYQQDLKEIDYNSFSTDNLKVIGKVLVQWRPDWKIKTAEGNNKFIENKRETIENGISGAIKSVIERIIGSVDAKVFIEMRSAVERYLSCILQLEKPPHVCPGEISDKCSSEDGEIMGVQERLAFYQENSGKINDKLRGAKARESYSEIEERYGIDIIMFKIIEVDFSKETQAAFEKEKQAKADMLGAQERRRGVSEIAHELSVAMPRLDDEIVLNAALVVANQAKKNINSVEGFKDLFKSADGKLILPEFLKGGKK